MLDEKHICPTCDGLGEVVCVRCQGKGCIYQTTTCSYCKGTGELKDGSECGSCENLGFIYLPYQCHACSGHGLVPCKKCKGTGLKR